MSSTSATQTTLNKHQFLEKYADSSTQQWIKVKSTNGSDFEVVQVDNSEQTDGKLGDFFISVGHQLVNRKDVAFTHALVRADSNEALSEGESFWQVVKLTSNTPELVNFLNDDSTPDDLMLVTVDPNRKPVVEKDDPLNGTIRFEDIGKAQHIKKSYYDFQKPVFLMMQKTGWNASPEGLLEQQSEGKYTVDFECVVGELEFKIASADWKTTDYGLTSGSITQDQTTELQRVGFGNNAKVYIDTAGKYRLSVENVVHAGGEVKVSLTKI